MSSEPRHVSHGRECVPRTVSEIHTTSPPAVEMKIVETRSWQSAAYGGFD